MRLAQLSILVFMVRLYACNLSLAFEYEPRYDCIAAFKINMMVLLHMSSV
ncbi:exported hypothetical protein [Xenorhabdus innexi]|uniref:Uncharacterized protein n=1 Tax=Xenorhabdus innexi TaxID=290109 RepID=A0A1N6MTQ6_9GAMM|nr:exported hypothetical protein [Xenorhabdus innexi]